MRIHEILETACKKRRDRKTFLKEQEKNAALRYVLQGAFDSSVKFLLPEGISSTFILSEVATSSIEKEYVQIPYFCEFGVGRRDSNLIREQKFLNLLKLLPKEDVNIMIAMKDKKLETIYKCLSKDLIVEIFPDLLVGK